MKKILLLIFARQSKIVKYLAILKNSYQKINKILPIVRTNKLKFIFKIIQGSHYVEFQPNLDYQKEYFKKNISLVVMIGFLAISIFGRNI